MTLEQIQPFLFAKFIVTSQKDHRGYSLCIAGCKLIVPE